MFSLQGRPLEMACQAWSSEASVELGQGGEAQKMHKKWVCADVTLLLFMRIRQQFVELSESSKATT